MELHHTTNRFEIEPLEQRRMLCGDLGDAHAALGIDHGSDIHAANEVVALGKEDSVGNVVSAFARDHHGARVLWGESTLIDGARVVTWALVSPRDNTILAAGVSFSLKLAQEMPAPGDGPAGAIASLAFPAVVQQTSFFNHLEIQSNQHGHEAPPGSVNPNRNMVPHFDFHFYAIPEEQVRAIPAGPPAPPVPANLLPPGYTQAGRSVPEMGRHSGPVWALSDPNPLTTIMLAGYLPNGSQMHFLEPMVSQDALLSQQDFTLPMPMPSHFGRQTLYPTSFEGVFQGNAYHLVFSDFVQTDVTSSAISARTVMAPTSQSINLTPDQGEDEEDDQAIADVLR